MNYIIFTLACICVLIQSSSGVFFSRRRRAPQPVKIDCSLSEWKLIKSCDKECGPSGVEVFERTIIIEGRNGGIVCSKYDLERRDPCNRDCHNGGTLTAEQCVCKAGWSGECCKEDVDECKESPCDQICKNQVGSFYCECEDFYTLDTDDRTCVDLEECQSAPCQHRCKEMQGEGYECYCDTGYRLADDGVSCDDIDECSAENVCTYKCDNTVGDYECVCEEGYTRNGDMKTCTDVDECSSDSGGCLPDTCFNTAGSFMCCGAGYTIRDNKLECVDIDECGPGSTVCQQRCINIAGGYRCECISPYMLNADQRTCTCTSTDAAECEAATEEPDGQGFDKDSMYNWIIGGLICVCLVLFGSLALVCVRKGYHKFYPPKPPPISTIPRFNNRLFVGNVPDDTVTLEPYLQSDSQVICNPITCKLHDEKSNDREENMTRFLASEYTSRDLSRGHGNASRGHGNASRDNIPHSNTNPFFSEHLQSDDDSGSGSGIYADPEDYAEDAVPDYMDMSADEGKPQAPEQDRPAENQYYENNYEGLSREYEDMSSERRPHSNVRDDARGDHDDARVGYSSRDEHEGGGFTHLHEPGSQYYDNI